MSVDGPLIGIYTFRFQERKMVERSDAFFPELNSKDFSEVIQHIKEKLVHGKDITSAELEKITEYTKHLSEEGIDTLKRKSMVFEDVLKSYLGKG